MSGPATIYSLEGTSRLQTATAPEFFFYANERRRWTIRRQLLTGKKGYSSSVQSTPELLTRSTIECGGKSKGAYDLPLHVIALFIILIQSIISCSFPLIVKKVPQLRVPHHFLFLSRHFGTGVLIATAFVHLLPTAFTSLTDPCLPPFWNTGYPAMAGLIAMMSVFIVVSIEMFFSTMNGGAMGGCHGGVDYESIAPGSPNLRPVSSGGSAAAGMAGGFNPVFNQGFPQGRRASVASLVMGGSPRTSAAGIRPPNRHRRSGSIGHQLTRIERGGGGGGGGGYKDTPSSSSSDHSDHSDHDEDYDGATELASLNTQPRKHSINNPRERRGRLTEEQQQKKNLLQVMLLEAGILFHSVFIGMALSVATGSNFIVLLIAITFHQTFEGLALGSRISSITLFPPRSWKPWLMCLAYGTTTPIGQAIGLLTRHLYDPQSQTGLLMVGVMNAISSGLLLFAGLVELLAEDFLSDESYVVLTGRRRVQACVAVMAGALGMALVGAWA
ncbi:Zinc/iron permease [Pyronema omphalodes]|nr:Zinc/iron permease [Pyronema omphalodes]